MAMENQNFQWVNNLHSQRFSIEKQKSPGQTQRLSRLGGRFEPLSRWWKEPRRYQVEISHILTMARMDFSSSYNGSVGCEVG